MLEWLAPQFRPFVGVLALAVLFVAMSSLVYKYRQWQAQKMGQAERLLRGVGRIEQAMLRLERFGMPRELAELCKAEMLARYRAVQSLLPRLVGMDERMRAAEKGPPAESLTRGWIAPDLADAAQLDRYTKALTGLVDFFASEAPVSELDARGLRTLREQLRTLRAEAHCGFRRQAMQAAAEAGEWGHAREEALLLLGFLRAKAPASERGKALYKEALGLYHDVEHRRTPGVQDQPDLSPGQERRVNAA